MKKETKFDFVMAFIIAVTIFIFFQVNNHSTKNIDENELSLGLPSWAVLEYPFEFINDSTGFFEDKAIEVLESNGYNCVTVTVYNAVAGQCNADFLTTASGRKINKDKLNEGELRWVALSRDLLEKYPYGSEIFLNLGEENEYTGLYLVADTMNVRFTNCVDILVPDNIRTGKWIGIINKEEL